MLPNFKAVGETQPELHILSQKIGCVYNTPLHNSGDK